MSEEEEKQTGGYFGWYRAESHKVLIGEARKTCALSFFEPSEPSTSRFLLSKQHGLVLMLHRAMGGRE